MPCSVLRCVQDILTVTRLGLERTFVYYWLLISYGLFLLLMCKHFICLVAFLVLRLVGSWIRLFPQGA